MLYIIGLGLNEKGLSLEGREAVKKCSQIYLENYTVEFPYSIDKLKEIIGKKFVKLDRGEVESEKLVKEARKEDIGLLVYGCPLFATTHMSLIDDCRDKRVKVKVIYSSSVFDAIGETGLQLYKFGKISSMPKWEKNFVPDSFLEFVEENANIGAHSLILVDLGLSFENAVKELEKACDDRKVCPLKIMVCSKLGTSKSKIYYGRIKDLKKKKVLPPFCFILPAKMHFMEEEVVRRFGV